MRKKFPESRVERILLVGRRAGGEFFFIRCTGEVGGRRAKRGGDDLKLVGAGLGFAGLPVLAYGWRAAMRRAMDALVTPVSWISDSNLL